MTAATGAKSNRTPKDFIRSAFKWNRWATLPSRLAQILRRPTGEGEPCPARNEDYGVITAFVGCELVHDSVPLILMTVRPLPKLQLLEQHYASLESSMPIPKTLEVECVRTEVMPTTMPHNR